MAAIEVIIVWRQPGASGTVTGAEHRELAGLGESGTLFERVQAARAAAAAEAQAAQAPPAPPSPARMREELREHIRQTTEEAVRAAREAQAEVGPTRVIVSPLDGQVITTETHVPRGMGGRHDGIPPEAVDMAIGFFIMCAVMVVGWPIARALGRRIERGASTPAVEPAVAAQLVRIEQAVESMAIEVERISESQRFVAKLQSRSSAERV